MALILTAVLVGQYLLFSRLGLKNVSYDLTVSTTEAFEGDEIEVVEVIENAKALPLPWIRTEISCSRWLSFYGVHSNKKDGSQKGLVSGVFMLKGYQKCRRVWKVRCEKRGVFTIEDVSVSVSDLFGLCKPAMVCKLMRTVRVLPTPADMQIEDMSAEAYIGDIEVKRFVLPDPFVISGAKEYTGREPMNRIHWAQSARTGTLMVYNSEYTTERRVLIILNLQRSFHSERQSLSVSVLEAQIKAAAYMLDHCYHTRTEYVLTANAPVWKNDEPACSYEHTIECLRRLAELSGDCGMHIDDLLCGTDFSGYTDVVLISSFLSDIAAQTLRTLCRCGCCCTVLSTDIEDTDICGVLHIPRGRYYPPINGE